MKRKPLVLILLSVILLSVIVAGIKFASHGSPAAAYAPHGGSGAFLLIVAAVLIAKRRRAEAEKAMKNREKESDV